MGTYTEFTGAVKITPMVEDALASRLNAYFDSRHMRRDVDELNRLYPDAEFRKGFELFDGEGFGPEGTFFVPQKTKEIYGRLSHIMGSEGLMTEVDINHPPAGCPGLYCDMYLAQAADGQDCSYLGWNGAEKPYNFEKWLSLLAAKLVPLGYHLEGALAADEEYGIRYYNIIVNDQTIVTVENCGPCDCTYDDEFQEALNRHYGE